MSRKVRLRAPAGTDEANHSVSATPYRVDNDGTVEVDEEAVGPLLERGGFTLLEQGEPMSSQGTIEMMNPFDKNASCGFDGVSYAPDADGVVTVPIEAVADMKCHGFVIAPPRAVKATSQDGVAADDAAKTYMPAMVVQAVPEEEIYPKDKPQDDPVDEPAEEQKSDPTPRGKKSDKSA